MTSPRPFTTELRDAARIEPDHLVKYNLNMLADELAAVMMDFAAMPTADALKALNGKWAQAYRLLTQRREALAAEGEGAA